MRASRAHRGFYTALVHRISGLALAIFLPLHFLALGLAFEEEAFGEFIAWTQNPYVSWTEAILVVALAAHFLGGLRILVVEFIGLTRQQEMLVSLFLGMLVSIAISAMMWVI